MVFASALPRRWEHVVRLHIFAFESENSTLTIHNNTMAPSHYYSQGESDALAWLSKHIPSTRGVKSQHVFSGEDDFFLGLQGRSDSSARGGRPLEQPLFKQSTSLAAMQQPALRLGWGQVGSTSASAAAPHTIGVHEDDLGDDPPNLAFADLDHQFSHWPYNTTSLTLNKQEDFSALVLGSDATTATTLTLSQQPRSQSSLNSQSMASPLQHHPSSTHDDTFPTNDSQDENAGAFKRAAIIAKAKTKPSSSTSGILASSTPTQRRAAHQKNRNRKPFLDPPASSLHQAKLMPKSKPAGQVELRYENTPEGHRTALTLAIQQGLINPDNDEEVTALMKTIRESTNRTIKDDTGELDKHITKGGPALRVIN
jgi:hypothetical protein